MGKPVVYGPVYSTFVRTVRAALLEKGVEYDLVPTEMMKGEHKQPEHLKRHPFGKVPAFEHNGFSIYETNATIHYIDDAFPGRRLTPADIHRRTRDQQIIDVVNAYCYPCIIGRIVLPRVFADKDKGPNEEAIATALPEAERALGAIQDLMTSPDPYLVGRDVALSDLFLAPIIHYLVAMPEGPKLLSKFPQLETWWGVIQQRDSVSKTVPEM